MSGYIGSKAVVVSNGAERKKTYSITGTTTSLTGLSYTVNQVHVFHNGVRLVDGTDFTATNGNSITLTNAAQAGDEVVVISYAGYQVSDTVSASQGGTFSSDVEINGDLTVDTNTLYVDSTNNNVGVGTSSPSYPLHTVLGAGESNGVGFLNAAGQGINFYTDSTASNADVFFDQGASGAALVFRQNATERMRIDASGYLIVPNGVTLGTSAGTYSAANTLDDYEEGTWTPVPDNGSFTSVNSTYTKIGSLVRITFDALVGTGGGSIIYGLPFTPADTTGFTPYFAAQDLPSGCLGMGWAIGGGATPIYVRSYRDNAGFVQTGLTSGATIHVDFTYRTTA